MLNEGPSSVELDDCRLSYDKLRFQGNITGRENYKVMPSGSLFVELPQVSTHRESQAWRLAEEGCWVLLCMGASDLVPFGAYTYRSRVRGRDDQLWVGMQRVHATLSIPAEHRGDAMGCPPGAGFCKADDAVTYLSRLLEATLGCYSLRTWTSTKLCGKASTGHDIMLLLNMEFEGLLWRLRHTRTDSLAQPLIDAPVYRWWRRMAQLSWICL